ncbi:prepilin-type cleavage/methylation domain-containing protein, partial [Vibrio sp. 2-2(9)]|nr:prepilin-type cleavage/methylation domain-containing protein [Vibrio sp. 2-2(9)]
LGKDDDECLTGSKTITLTSTNVKKPSDCWN